MKIFWQIFSMIIGVLAFLIAAYYLSIWHLHDYSKDFLKADSCLTSGGVYVYSESRCYLPGQCEDEGGKWNAIEKNCDK